MKAKNTICLWFDKDAHEAARFYAATFPNSEVMAASVDTSKPATRGRFKAGHHGVASETGGGLPRSLLRVQVGVDLGAPASGPALEDVGMVEQAVE